MYAYVKTWLADDILVQGSASPLGRWLRGDRGPVVRRTTGGGARDRWPEAGAAGTMCRGHREGDADPGLSLFGLSWPALWREAAS